MATLVTDPIPHEAGRDLIAGKLPVQRAVFDRLLPELQARAFMVTGVECANVLQRVRDLAAQLPVGGDFKDLKGKIFDELSPWLVTDSDPEEAAKQLAEAGRRAEMLLRMHGWQAYAQTQYEEMEEMTDIFPYRQYLSSEDARVRQTHAALNRKIFPADHPFWHNHTPPWEFGCRCDVVALMEEEVDELRAAEAGKAIEERDVIEGAMLDEVERGNLVMPGGAGRLDIRTPREKKGATGYEWRPGDRGLDMAWILDRYDPAVRADFQSWAQGQRLDDGRTAWEAFGGDPAAVPPAPVPQVPSQKAQAPMKAGKKAAPPAEEMRAKIAGAKYVAERPLGSTGVNTSFRVKNGVEIVFKPKSGEDPRVLRAGIRPGEQYLREKAASIIDQHLGTDLVPPTEIITWKGETGSAQLFRAGWKTGAKAIKDFRAGLMRARRMGLSPVAGSPFNLDPETERRWSLLDDVLGHLDRHHANFMVRRDAKTGFHKFAAIDNGLCLSAEPMASGIAHPTPLAGDPLDAVSRAQLDDFVARRADWEPQVRGLVGDKATDLMFDRIERLKKNGFGLGCMYF